MELLNFKYQRLNKQGPTLTLPIKREDIPNQAKVLENEKYVFEQFNQTTYSAEFCYILVTIGEEGYGFLNTIMSHGVIKTQIGHLPSKQPLFNQMIA